MNQKKLIELLRVSGTDAGDRTRFCPDDEAIAGFVDGAMEAAVQRSIVQHLAECAVCVARVGRLTRLMRADSKTGGVTDGDDEPASWRRHQRWAAAAAIVITFGFIGASLQTPAPDTEMRDTRSAGSGSPAPRIQAPETGLDVQSGSLIEWTSVPESLYYEVRIVSDVGDIVSTFRVDESTIRVNGMTDLEPGREYFIRVEARLPDNRSSVSEHVPLRVLQP